MHYRIKILSRVQQSLVLCTSRSVNANTPKKDNNAWLTPCHSAGGGGGGTAHVSNRGTVHVLNKNHVV